MPGTTLDVPKLQISLHLFILTSPSFNSLDYVTLMTFPGPGIIEATLTASMLGGNSLLLRFLKPSYTYGKF